MCAEEINAIGTHKENREIKVSISCGRVMINQRDFYVGDEDCVVVIDPQYALEVLAKAQATKAKESDFLAFWFFILKFFCSL